MRKTSKTIPPPTFLPDDKKIHKILSKHFMKNHVKLADNQRLPAANETSGYPAESKIKYYLFLINCKSLYKKIGKFYKKGINDKKLRTALKNEALFEDSILFKKVNFEPDFKKIITIVMLDYNLLDENKLMDDCLNNNCRFAINNFISYLPKNG